MGQSLVHSTILFLGLESTGKTSIIKFCDNGFKVKEGQEIQPTMGHEISHIKQSKVQFTAFDVPGKKRFHEIWKKYYKECDAIVWVIDSSAEDIQDSQDTLANVLQSVEVRNAIFLVVYNKQDKKDAKKPKDLDDVLGLAKLMGKRQWKSIGCSAVSGEGIQEGKSIRP